MDSPEFAETAAETVSLFATQVFINSAGLRYVPLPVDTESCLIEGFPEGEQPVTELLKALGLSRRRGLARADIENALLLHGGRVLEERLGLDPREFRLVCIPPDLYLRIGRERSWGQRPEWTHFDGYRVLQGGRLLALVGGNARYGGRVDLAAIGPTDERDSVLARFAVIRRDRLGPGRGAGPAIAPLWDARRDPLPPDGGPRQTRRRRPRESRRAATQACRHARRSRGHADAATAR